jgi:hypothetical protein
MPAQSRGEPFVAGAAVAAAAAQAADADRVADLEAGHVAADGADLADDLVAGDAGIERARPFGTDCVQVGMADAAKGDLDLDVARAGRTAVDVERLERLVGGMGAIGFDGHEGFPRPMRMARPRKAGRVGRRAM